MTPVNRIRYYLPRARQVTPPPNVPLPIEHVPRAAPDSIACHQLMIALLIGFIAGAVFGPSAGKILDLLWLIWQA